MSSITTHPDQASSRPFINSQRDSLLLLVIWRRKYGDEEPEHTKITNPNQQMPDLPVPVRVSGLLPQPVNGVEVLVRADVRERFIQEVH